MIMRAAVADSATALAPNLGYSGLRKCAQRAQRRRGFAGVAVRFNPQ